MVAAHAAIRERIAFIDRDRAPDGDACAPRWPLVDDGMVLAAVPPRPITATARSVLPAIPAAVVEDVSGHG